MVGNHIFIFQQNEYKSCIESGGSMENITKIGQRLGLLESECIPYGFDKAKVDLSVLKRLKNHENGKLILVTAINPTKAGEGKTTTSIGLAQGLTKIGKKAVLALREPSLGPVFGLKGGATGGGLASIVPVNDINLHFTGDLHAITAANNLLSAMIDNHIYQGNELNIKTVIWKRCMDMNDRALRKIETPTRPDGFIITAASEIMAILALASDITDLKKRINSIMIGYNEDGKPLYVSDMGCADAMVLLLKDAIKPNLVQTLDGVPALVHAGPFANIAHGCNSIIATKMAMKLGEYTVTEAGFGADLGMEKFLNIKTPYLPKHPDLVVLVATLRALKLHGDAEDFNAKDIDALKKGIKHLEKHITNIKGFGLHYVIALNHFKDDDKEELALLLDWTRAHNHPVALADGFSKGAEGMVDLAKLVVSESDKVNQFKHTYDANDSTKEKIEKVAKQIYGADRVIFYKKAIEQLETYEKLHWQMPICMAKTPLSLSGDAKLKGVPKGFALEIKAVKPSMGAGFFVALTKGIMTMPGLNKTPRALGMKVDDDGNLIEE